MKKLFLLAIVALGFTVSAYAQPTSVTATAGASAKITAALALQVAEDMDFGSIVPSATAGDVILNPTNLLRSKTGGVTIVGSTYALASFNVLGSVGSNFSISIPTGDVNITSGANTMIVNGWNSVPDGSGVIPIGGIGVITVGATLKVGATQPFGNYVNLTAIPVTVDYE